MAAKKKITKKKESTGTQSAIDERGTGKKKIPGHIIINKKGAPGGKWFVVHTTSGHEARVA